MLVSQYNHHLDLATMGDSTTRINEAIKWVHEKLRDTGIEYVRAGRGVVSQSVTFRLGANLYNINETLIRPLQAQFGLIKPDLTADDQGTCIKFYIQHDDRRHRESLTERDFEIDNHQPIHTDTIPPRQPATFIPRIVLGTATVVVVIAAVGYAWLFM